MNSDRHSHRGRQFWILLLTLSQILDTLNSFKQQNHNFKQPVVLPVSYICKVTGQDIKTINNPPSFDISSFRSSEASSCLTEAAVICLHQRYGRFREHSLNLKSIRSTAHFSENGRFNLIHVPQALSLTVGVLILHSTRTEQKLFKLLLPPPTFEASLDWSWPQFPWRHAKLFG